MEWQCLQCNALVALAAQSTTTTFPTPAPRPYTKPTLFCAPCRYNSRDGFVGAGVHRTIKEWQELNDGEEAKFYMKLFDEKNKPAGTLKVIISFNTQTLELGTGYEWVIMSI